MTKKVKSIILFILMLFSLAGCDRIGSKSTSISTIYGAITVISLLLLVTYCVIIHKKELWFLLLFSSVFIVNIGYFSLSISKTIEEALLANRIAYLGSVFLPMSMLMIIMNVCKLRYRKWLPCLLLLVSVFVFLVAASPGYCDIYYKDVVLQTVNGVSILDKTYGKWHSIYLFYLAFYFGVMVIMSIRVSVNKKMGSNLYAIILVGSVFVNMGVWLLEQFVKIDLSEPAAYGARRQPRLFYLWGHSYEFDRDNNWEHLEGICEKLSGKEDTWYATNMQIYDYITAYHSLIYSADGTRVYNPTLQTIWFDVDRVLYSVEPGETIKIK